MPVSSESVKAERQVMDQALSSTEGLILKFKTEERRTYTRHRLYQARSLDRENSRKIYNPDSELYGKSPYDDLAFSAYEEGEKGERLAKEDEMTIPSFYCLTISPAKTANAHLDCLIIDIETKEELEIVDDV